MYSDEPGPAPVRIPADLSGRQSGQSLAGLIDVLDRADGGPVRRTHRTTAARAGSVRARPLRPIPMAPASRRGTNGSVRPAVPVRPAPIAEPVGPVRVA